MDDSLVEKAVKMHGDTVLRVAYSVAGNRHDAEDVFSDVFFELYKRLTPFNDGNHLKAWLIRSAWSRAKNIKNSAWRRHRAELDENLQATKSDFSFELRDAMQKLKDDDRAVLYLHYYEGYTFVEIAKMLGMNESSVRSRASRARTTLKDYLS